MFSNLITILAEDGNNYSIFAEIFRGLCSMIDSALFWLINNLYQLFMDIATANVFGNLAQNFSSRIYTILGLFMLFKVSFSFINYIINPDDMTGREKGVGNLVKNLAIVLVLIVVTPIAFNYAYRIQAVVLSSNVIPSFILGTSNSENSLSDSKYVIAEQGINIAYLTFSSFLRPSEKAYVESNSDNKKAWDECAKYSGNIFADNTSKASECRSRAGSLVTEAYNGYANTPVVSDTTLKDKYNQASKIVSAEMYNMTVPEGKVLFWDYGKRFLFDQTPLISTIAGIFVAYIFIVFCFDIAVRTIKLALLEIIAPIPIMSRIDPKAAGGNSMFNKWVRMCISTYLDVFMRLAIIFFAIFFIKEITSSNMKSITGNDITNPFVTLFLIFGALLFAKQLPMILQDLTGIRLAPGGLSLGAKLRPTLDAGRRMRGTAKMTGRGINKFKSGIGKGAALIGGGIAATKAGSGFLSGMGHSAQAVMKGYSGKDAVSYAKNRTETVQKFGIDDINERRKELNNVARFGGDTTTDKLESAVGKLKNNINSQKLDIDDFKTNGDYASTFGALSAANSKLNDVKTDYESYRAKYLSADSATRLNMRSELDRKAEAYQKAANNVVAAKNAHAVNEQQLNQKQKDLVDMQKELSTKEYELSQSKKLDAAATNNALNNSKSSGGSK